MMVHFVTPNTWLHSPDWCSPVCPPGCPTWPTVHWLVIPQSTCHIGISWMSKFIFLCQVGHESDTKIDQLMFNFNFAIDLAHHQRSIPLLIIFIHFWTGRVPYPNGHKEISISQYKEQSLPIIPYKTCCRPDGWCEQHHLIPEDVQKILRRMTTSYLRLGGTKSPLLSQFLQSWWNQGRIW